MIEWLKAHSDIVLHMERDEMSNEEVLIMHIKPYHYSTQSTLSIALSDVITRNGEINILTKLYQECQAKLERVKRNATSNL